MSRVDFTADLRVLFKPPTWRAYHMILLYVRVADYKYQKYQ